MRPLAIFSFFLASVVCCAGAIAQAPQPSDRPEDHAALRALLEKSTEALNTRNFDAIASSLHSGFTMITVDNQKFVGLDAFKKYYLSFFEGPNAKLTKFETRLTADEVTRFLDENTGVVYGTSQDTYHFKDGDVRTMPTRWSAVIEKEAGGWKVVNAHFSANVVDNPIVEYAKAALVKAAAIAGVAGFVLGLLLMYFMRGKRA